MPKTKLPLVLFITLICSLTIVDSHAQSRKRLRELEKMKQGQEQDEDSAKEEAQERHLSIQSKETIKQMKEYERKNKRLHKNKRQPLFKRWFGHRERRARRRKRNG